MAIARWVLATCVICGLSTCLGRNAVADDATGQPDFTITDELPEVIPFHLPGSPSSSSEQKKAAKTHIEFAKSVGFGSPSDPLMLGRELQNVRIYEGMTIDLDKDGRYTLICTVEAPATTVTMRLGFQFLISERTGENLTQNCEPWAEITVPPIRLEPGTTDGVGGLTRVYNITYSGRAPRLDRLQAMRDPTLCSQYGIYCLKPAEPEWYVVGQPNPNSEKQNQLIDTVSRHRIEIKRVGRVTVGGVPQ